MTCSKCGKPTFAGCGMHEEQVLAGVPKDKRCTCRQDAVAAAKKQEAQPTSTKKPEASFWKRW
ncbi:MAG: hypothetical protein U0441_27610 [Polyangiaceae bacterium]